jgi:hypothetical protein
MDDAGVAGGNWSVTVDGGPATNFNRDGEHNMSWWTPFVYRITGLSAGSHTIVATKGTTDGYFDCWWMEASKPPLTLVVNQGYTSSYNATIRGYLNDKLLDSVAAFFDGYTRLVDVSSLITSDHVSDGTHLNDSGHALMAQTIVRAAIDAKRSLEYSSANAILGSGLSRQPHAVDGLGANFIQPNKPNVNGLVIRQSNKPGYVYGDSSSTYKYQAVDLLQIQDKDGNAIGGFDRNAQLYTKVAPGIGVFPYTQWKNTSDTQPSFAIDGNGGLWWGPGGSTAIDTYIGRSAADTLSLASGDSLVIPNGSVTVGDSTSNTFSKVDAGTYRATIPNGIGTFSFYQKKDLADANPVFGIGSDGRIYLGAGGASAVDVSIGRSSADTLGLTSGDSLDVPSGKITAAGNFGSLASVISGTNANSAGIGVSGSGGTGLYGTGTTAALLAVSTSNGIAVNAQASGTGAAIEALNSGSAPAIKINTSHGSGAALDINSQGNIVNVPTIDFDDTVADKLLLYSNTYGIGIEGSTITQWSQTNHRWRVGGTSASSGTEHMLLTSSSLDVKSKPVVNVTNPTNAQDAATKSYVDTEVADLGAAWNCVYDFGMAFLALDAGAAEWGFFQHTSGMLIVGLNTYQQPVKQFWIDSADYGSVPGKNLRFRIRGWANVNGTDPNLTVDFKMKPITFTGAADTLTTTLGTQVGNTASVTNANLGTNESEKANSTSFAIPTNGLYTVTATFSGTLANNAAINVGCRVECRYE